MKCDACGKTEAPEECRSCRYFREPGDCRKESPSWQSAVETQWPKVKPTDWCGDFERKRNG